jgi:pimeloyl-ACP methyl ester carboxylesterase
MKMLKKTRGISATLLIVLIAVLTAVAQNGAEIPKGKPPIIIIPGITGSELVNRETGRLVWFRTFRSKDDDIRLPISPNLAENKDDLIPGDIIRGVRIIRFLPEVEIYERLISSLEERGGYTEGKWDEPGEDGHQDKFYVFPYDWRRDNVETARLLVRRVDELKKKLGKPNLKFNIIAHSMGGLISRYAAMYGDADIPLRPQPTWAGARHFDKIFLVGTPNEGSVRALDALLNGLSYVGGGINIPFMRNITRFDVFSIPSIYQLLPHNASLRAYDEDLKPLKIDIYDPQTWEEYDWSIWKDRGFQRRVSRQEQQLAQQYFRVALERAKNFHDAINISAGDKVPVSFYLIGADCKDTPSGFILRRNEKRDSWITQFKPGSFRRSNGDRVSADEVRPLLLTNGDSVVTKSSLSWEGLAANGLRVVPVVQEFYQCESHNRLVTNLSIQNWLFSLLNGLPIEQSQLIRMAGSPTK